MTNYSKATPDALITFLEGMLAERRAAHDPKTQGDLEDWIRTEGWAALRAAVGMIKKQRDTSIGTIVPEDLARRDYRADTVQDVVAGLRSLIWRVTQGSRSPWGGVTILPVDWVNIMRAATLLERYVPPDDLSVAAPSTWLDEEDLYN